MKQKSSIYYIMVLAACLLCGCQPKAKRPTYHEQKAQRIDSMIEAAQKAIPPLDSALQRTIRQYDSLNSRVEAHREALRMTESELNELAALRLRRDSLQVRFDTECARVRFLHRKKEEIILPSQQK